MFRNIFTKSLRDYRWAILGWGIGLGIVVYAQYATFASTFTGASAAQIQQLVQQFQFFGEAVRVGTPGGFVTFKIMGLMPVILGIWTVLAGARLLRGEEERGALDILLSTPQSRRALLVQKLLALAAAVGLIALLIAGGMTLGMGSAQAAVDPAAAVLASLNVGLAAFLFGMIALLLVQFMSRAAAAGWAGGVMALCFVLEGTGRAVSSASGLRPISLLYWYDQNLPLVPGYAPHWGALGLLVLFCVIVAGAAGPLFLRRDIGRSVLADVPLLHRGAARQPAGQALARADREVWVRDVGLQALRRQGVSMFWWIVSLAIFSGYLVVVAKTSEKQLAKLLGGSPLFKHIFSGANIGTNNGFLSALVFSYLPLLLPIFTGIMANRWTTDLDNGRLELVLATPQPRRRVILERYAAVLTAAILATLGVWLATVLVAQSIGFSLEADRVGGACLGMLPLALITASLVFLLAEVLPPGAVLGIMAVFLATSFLAEILRSLLALPDWVLNLSIFHQYGTPMLHGVNWTSFTVMLLIAAAMLALAVQEFTTRDVDRGAVAG